MTIKPRLRGAHDINIRCYIAGVYLDYYIIVN